MERYTRQTLLPEIGEKGQQKLAESRVLIIGLGGLGTPISTYLAAAGIGKIGLIDDDVVSLNNLQRQVLYSENEIGRSKVEQAKKRLSKLNSTITIETYPERFTAMNSAHLISQYDIIVDGCDNYDTREIINEACLRHHKPYVYGAVMGWQGQISLFGSTPDGRQRSYHDLYPETPPSPSKNSPLGILGATASVVGSLQAAQVIKLICGCAELLSGKLLTIDLRSLQTQLFSF